MTITVIKTPYPAGLIRRIAALIYDSLVVTAILLLATAIAMSLISFVMGSEAITEQNVMVENPLVFIWTIFCWFSYYAWCWRNGGQTLGMRAWRLKLVAMDEGVPSYRNCILRFATAAFGLANFWVLTPAKKGWHDILSHSSIVVIDKNS